MKSMSSKELGRLLNEYGFVADPKQNQKGSHLRFKNPESHVSLTVPQGEKDIPRGTLKKIMDMAGLRFDKKGDVVKVEPKSQFYLAP